MGTFVGEFEQIFKEVVFGLSVMSLVTLSNIYAFTEISLGYQRTLINRKFKSRHLEILRFMRYVMLLVIFQILSVGIWAVALVMSGFVKDWMAAVMLTASFFTSVGDAKVSLPTEWLLIPSLIAFTGLFSIAWASASTINMARSLSDLLKEHRRL
jgi:hypothetical protein